MPLDPNDLDEVVHARVRLSVLAYLSAAGRSDFLAILDATRTTKGNLSTHLGKLEHSGYVRIEKGFVGKTPRTSVEMTSAGMEAFELYLRKMQQFLDAAK